MSAGGWIMKQLNIYSNNLFNLQPQDLWNIQGSNFTTTTASVLAIWPDGSIYATTSTDIDNVLPQASWTCIVSGGAWTGNLAVPDLTQMMGGSMQNLIMGVGDAPNYLVDSFANVWTYGDTIGGGNPIQQNLVALREAIPQIKGFELTDDYMTQPNGIWNFLAIASGVGFELLSINPSSNPAYWQAGVSTFANVLTGINVGFWANPPDFAAIFPGVPLGYNLPYMNGGYTPPQGRCPWSYTDNLANQGLSIGSFQYYEDFVANPPPYPHCQGAGGPCQLQDYAAVLAAL